MDEILNHAKLNFDSSMHLLLNACLAVIMFGVSLDLKVNGFYTLIKAPKPFLVGIASQYLLLPFVTALLILLLNISPWVAMGMLVVASCPGGNVSNFFTHLSGGNVALSVSLSLFSTIGAVIFTPLLISFLSQFLITDAQVSAVEISMWEMVKTISIILLLPVSLGLWLTRNFPHFVNRIKSPVRMASFVILVLFVSGALAANWSTFKIYIGYIIMLVVTHNLLAFALGFGLARLTKCKAEDVKAISIETGIQNTGLGLVLVFTFFDGNGAMSLIAACWGIWHLLSGTLLALLFKRFSNFKI